MTIDVTCQGRRGFHASDATAAARKAKVRTAHIPDDLFERIIVQPIGGARRSATTS